jgi:CheY-like chemotaxis protein
VSSFQVRGLASANRTGSSDATRASLPLVQLRAVLRTLLPRLSRLVGRLTPESRPGQPFAVSPERTMSGSDNRRSDRRRSTILVTSPSPAFAEIVGEMVRSGGFRFAATRPAESASLSVTRTQPVLVICDAGGPEDSVRRLIAETLARRLPLLLLGMTEEHASDRGRSLPIGVAWLQFPLARDVFQSAVDELLAGTSTVGGQFVLSGAGVAIEVGVVTHSLDGTSPMP